MRINSRASSVLPAWLIVVLMAAIGLNLRATLGAIPPLLGDISAELGLSGLAQAGLTSVAILAMGVFAPVGQRMAARWGAEVTTAAMLALLSVSGFMRLAATTTAILMVSVALAGASMGAASAIVPALIAQHVPRIRGFTTGIYSTGLAMGVAIAAWIAVPTEQWLGGWRPALAVWGVFAGVTAVAWIFAIPALHRDPSRPARLRRGDTQVHLPWRSPTAWMVTGYTSMIMLIGFSGLAWVTPYYVSLGYPDQDAANLLVLFQVVQLLAMLTLPTITDHTKDRRPLLALSLGLGLLGIAGLVFAPTQLAIPSVALFGLGLGGSSPLALVVLVDYAGSPANAARLGAMMMLIAYPIGAIGPVILGAVRDATGSFSVGYSIVWVLGILTFFTIPVFRPDRHIDDHLGHLPTDSGDGELPVPPV